MKEYQINGYTDKYLFVNFVQYSNWSRKSEQNMTLSL